MDSWIEWLAANLAFPPDLIVRFVLSLVAIILLILLRRWSLSLLFQRIADPELYHRWRRIIHTLFFSIATLLVAVLWLESLGNLATFFGLLAAGLAIALREPVTNLVGWVFIVWRRPFTIGDRIQIGEIAGDVVDLRAFQTILLEIGNWVHADQSTGRIIHIPNGRIFSDHLANYSSGLGYIWNEIPVLITFESDWKKARGLLDEIVNQIAAEWHAAAQQAAQEAGKKMMIRYSVLTPTIYTSVEASGVLLTMRYLCPPRQRRSSAQRTWEAILDAFARHADIDFAYPTQRFYTASSEGKRPPML